MIASAQPSEQFVTIAGARVHLQSAGHGAPLLYLHGAGSAGQWPKFLDGLTGRYQVLAPTHPGFGQSSRLEWIDSVDELVFFYLDLLDELALDEMCLIGHSLGGWIAAALATIANHRIKRLVLSDPAGINPDGIKLPDLFVMSEAELAHLTVHDEAEAERQASAEPTLEELERQLSDRAALAHLAWNPYLHDPKLPFRLHRVRMPTLLIWGRQDGLLPVELAQSWLRALPQARLEIVDGAGHSPARERPAEVIRLVLDFLGDEKA